jgi:hypothetical protein
MPARPGTKMPNNTVQRRSANGLPMSMHVHDSAMPYGAFHMAPPKLQLRSALSHRTGRNSWLECTEGNALCLAATRPGTNTVLRRSANGLPMPMHWQDPVTLRTSPNWCVPYEPPKLQPCSASTHGEPDTPVAKLHSKH